jgi:hypothetical protein
MNTFVVNNLSSINIGKSVTNILCVKLISTIDLKNTFILTDPYGTSRVRFGYPEMFTYTLTQLHSLDKSSYDSLEELYELQIQRNEKILSVQTSKYFFGEGWHFDLKITFVPLDKGQSQITPEIVTCLLPKDYTYNIPKIVIKDKINIGIVIPCFSRKDYLEQFLNSIKDSDLSGCILLFMDESISDNCPNPITQDRIEVHNTISSFMNNIQENESEFTGSAIHITKKYHSNMFDSILHGFDILQNYCKFLMTIDSDTIMKHNWISKLLKTVKNIGYEKKYILSGFNTTNTKRHLILHDNDKYYEKSTIGGCHIMFDVKYYSELRCTLNSHKWDTNIVQHAKKLKYNIYVTKPSVIDHIGYESSGHRNDLNISNNFNTDIACDYNNKKVIMVCAFNYLINRMDKTSGYIFQYIHDYSSYDVYNVEITDITAENQVTDIINKEKKEVIVIFLYSIPSWKIINSIKNKIYLIEDVCCSCGYVCRQSKKCGFKNIFNCVKENNITTVISRYDTYLINTLNVDVKYFRYYYSIYGDKFNVSPEKKIYDLLIYGNVSLPTYPMRRKIYDMFKKNNYGLNVKFLFYSGKKSKHLMTTGENLADNISKSWLTLTTKSINNLLLGKYYEASIYGSVPIGDFPDLEKIELLKKEMIILSLDMSENDILNIIKNALSNKEELIRKSIILQEYFRKNYSLEQSSIVFDNIIHEIINK